MMGKGGRGRGGNEIACWEMGMMWMGVLGNGGEEWEEMKGRVGGGSGWACWEILCEEWEE